MTLRYELQPIEDTKGVLCLVYKCDGCGREVTDDLKGRWWRLLDDLNGVLHFCGFDCIDRWVQMTRIRTGGPL